MAKFFMELDKGTVMSCPHCSSPISIPESLESGRVSCPKCDTELYDESTIVENLLNYYEAIYNEGTVVYDENVENTIQLLNIYTWIRQEHRALKNAFQKICDEVLGEDYYIVDPVNGLQAIEVITRDILKTLNKKSSSKNKKKGVFSWVRGYSF